MNKKDNRLKELRRLRYECDEIIKEQKKKLKEIKKEEEILINNKKLLLKNK